MLRRGLSFVAGAALGVVLWWMCTPQYNRVLALASTPLARIDRRLAAAVLMPRERTIFITSSTALPTATIPADQLTYNVILLLGLFAANARPLRVRNLRALAIAAAIVFTFHCLGLLISIESTYALRQGEWSSAHYGDAAGRFWLTAELVYRTVGMFGVVFASWWTLSREPQL
ncbi:MAG: hypothetical protein JWO97_2962 [Acidobacteria bacterium]|nr:hypothetical protein [Acidobacteriota bacterium]